MHARHTCERRKLRTSDESIARTVPRVAARHAHISGFGHRGFALDVPSVTLTHVKRDIDLAHPRIERREDARSGSVAPCLLRDREERWDRDDRQIRAERQSFDLFDLLGAGGQHDDRKLTALPEHREKLESVAVGQREIEHQAEDDEQQPEDLLLHGRMRRSNHSARRQG